MRLVSFLFSLGLLFMTETAQAAQAQRSVFGKLPDGREVEAVTLTNDQGMQVRLIELGATVQSVVVPDRNGRPADVTLGYPTLEGYLGGSEYFGATVGRVANRIARGRFELDGRTYQTPVNNGENALHGGTEGFDRKLWELTDVRSGRQASATFRLVSPHGDQGYPGELAVTATYTLNEQNELGVEYRATTDRPTVVNLANHAYWNLAGEGAGTAMDHLVTIPAESFLPVDKGLIPTGEFRPVAGTPFDFRQPTRVAERIRADDQQIAFGRGYDHNWVISREVAPSPRLVARAEDPGSGRVVEVLSDQPGVQFYSGNFLDGTVRGKSGRFYRQGDTVVFEPQKFPDTPNQPAFGSVRLDPGQSYRNRTIFRFSTTPAR